MNEVAMMRKTSVLNKEYEQLQTTISSLRDKWFEQLTENIVEEHEVTSSTPMISQVKLAIHTDQYKGFISELVKVMEENQPELAVEMNKITSLLSEETLAHFATAAIEMNTTFFEKYAKDNELEEWLVLFIAENAVRPYLQKAAEELTPELEKVNKPTHCPACGEPPRMARIGQSGKMEVTCPRCNYTWGAKKISCVHCGTDNHEDILVIKVEGDEQNEIHACKNCNCYTKVIKTVAMLKVPNTDLLDIKTIHLDYIAQDKGYESAKKSDIVH